MEIALDPELMSLLKQFLGTASRIQYQYLLSLVPALLFFGVYLMVMGSPLKRRLLRKWHVWQFERETKSTVVSLIHTPPSGLASLLSPSRSMITLDDSYKFLRAFKEIPSNRPVRLVLHTPGGMVIAAEQIARAIKARGGVECYVPQYAMSGGTLVALACDKIHMGASAILGPLDPQLMVGLFDQYPCASLVRAVNQPNAHRDDRTLVYADVAEKAIVQMKATVIELVSDWMGREKAGVLADQLCSGLWTHDYGLDYRKALGLELLVDEDVPSRIDKVSRTFSCESVVEYRKPKGGSGSGSGSGSLRIVL